MKHFMNLESLEPSFEPQPLPCLKIARYPQNGRLQPNVYQLVLRHHIQRFNMQDLLSDISLS